MLRHRSLVGTRHVVRESYLSYFREYLKGPSRNYQIDKDPEYISKVKMVVNKYIESRNYAQVKPLVESLVIFLQGKHQLYAKNSNVMFVGANYVEMGRYINRLRTSWEAFAQHLGQMIVLGRKFDTLSNGFLLSALNPFSATFQSEITRINGLSPSDVVVSIY